MKFTTEQGIERSYLRISDPEYHYSFGYYSNNSWVDDHRIVLARFKAADPAKIAMHSESVNATQIQLVLVDIEAKTEKILTEPLLMSYTDYELDDAGQVVVGFFDI